MLVLLAQYLTFFVMGALTSSAPVSPSPVQWLARAATIRDDLIETRREFHMYPELSLAEHNTSDRIRRHLDALFIPHFSLPSIPTAVFGLLGAPPSPHRPTIALRADIDALPIQEALDDLPYKSRNPGVMHACGHDAHITILLGAARLLKDHETKPAGTGTSGKQSGGGYGLPGSILLVFQPAEEGKGGAKMIVDSGVLQQHGVRAVLGLHVWPELPSGHLGVREGVLMAASDRFRVVIQGKGGHAALPHLAVDPVIAAAAVVSAAQSLVSRETSPLASAVLSITRFNTGPGAPNVIPDSVELQGTIRALTEVQHNALRTRFTAVVAHIAELHRCTYTIEWSPVPYPPTVNDKRLTGIAREVGLGVFGEAQTEDLAEPSMAAEDFAFYSNGQTIPTLFSFVGIGGPLAEGRPRGEFRPPAAGLHSPSFVLDDAVLDKAAAFTAATAMAVLEKLEFAGEGSEFEGVRPTGESDSTIIKEL